MANLMLKFTKILNGRLLFSSTKHFNGHVYKSYLRTKHAKSYATAAYKLAVNEDSGVKSNDPESSTFMKDKENIDAALAKIDSVIRWNGRTQLKNVRKIFSTINSKEVTTSSHGLYLLRSCKYCCDEPQSKRIELVNQIWNKYKELGVEFDVMHYNALLDVHIANCLEFDPVEILASMEDVKVEPNKDTYMLIMKKYCQDGNINGASEILEYMKEKQMSVDEKVFNYLIEGHIKNNDIEGAKEMLYVMRSLNLQPTADTHAVLACGYAALGNKEEMMTYLKECSSIDSAGNYLKVIEVLADSGNHQYIDEVLLSLMKYNKEYRHHLINSAVKLIHKNFTEIAYKLAAASVTPSYNEGVNIFIKQLIKCGKEPAEIIQFCERIQNEGLNKKIFLIAAQIFVEFGRFNCLVPVFKKAEELGHFLKSSSFWPLFVYIKEHKFSEESWLILKYMNELGVVCDFKTYIDFVYPSLGVSRPGEIFEGIRQSGQSLQTAADALFVYYCNKGEIDYAFELTEKIPIAMSMKFDVKNFVTFYNNINPESVVKYFKLLKYIFMEDSSMTIKSDVQGKLLAELITRRERVLEILLDKFEDLKFSEHILYTCEQLLRETNPSKLAYLKKIKRYYEIKGNILKQENISIQDEDIHIRNLRAENISCKSFLKKRILHHIKEKNITRVHQLLLIYDELKLEYSPLMLSDLFGLWCIARDLDKAEGILEKLKTNHSNFKLDLLRVFDYVNLLVKYEKFDEGFEALKNFLVEPYIYHNKVMLERSVKSFNTTLSNTQNNDYVKKMQNLILPVVKELGIKKSLLDPSVDVHLARNDLTSALEEFRNIIITHHVPASLNEFLKKCIITNEKEILQQVIDLTINCSGKSYALLELAVAFIETYNTQKALKVIENLGEEINPKVLEDMCIRLQRQKKLNELETLIFITKSLNHVAREQLYYYALKACASKNDFQRALKLVENLKEEVFNPSSETVKLIQDLFKVNNQPVPMSIISKDLPEINPLAAEATKIFLKHLEAGDSEAVLKELNCLKKGYVRTLPIKALTDLVDLCLQKKCVHNLSLKVHAMSYILDNVKDVLKPILEKYSEAGDVEKFALIMSFIPDFSLINIGFNNYFCKAFLSCGKYEDLISHMEEHVGQKNKLFSSIVFEELLKLPEYEERLFNLAVKYLESNYHFPMSIIWAYYFSNENYEKADEICKKYFFNPERVDIIILKAIKQNENVELAKKYVEFIKTYNVRSRLKERAFGAYADLLVFKGMYDDAANLIVESEKLNLQLHKYYLSTLVNLKSILEKENKPVPFNIKLDMSSGSSSDTE